MQAMTFSNLKVWCYELLSSLFPFACEWATWIAPFEEEYLIVEFSQPPFHLHEWILYALTNMIKIVSLRKGNSSFPGLQNLVMTITKRNVPTCILKSRFSTSLKTIRLFTFLKTIFSITAIPIMGILLFNNTLQCNTIKNTCVISN